MFMSQFSLKLMKLLTLRQILRYLSVGDGFNGGNGFLDSITRSSNLDSVRVVVFLWQRDLAVGIGFHLLEDSSFLA